MKHTRGRQGVRSGREAPNQTSVRALALAERWEAPQLELSERELQASGSVIDGLGHESRSRQLRVATPATDEGRKALLGYGTDLPRATRA